MGSLILVLAQLRHRCPHLGRQRTLQGPPVDRFSQRFFRLRQELVCFYSFRELAVALLKISFSSFLTLYLIII
jgi:hypothetical protein